MDRGSFPYKPTPEDHLIISRWKRRLGMTYGAILLLLVLVILASSNRNRSEMAKQSINRGFSSASVADQNRSR